MAIEIVRLPLKMLIFDSDINLPEGIPQMAMGNIEKHMKRQQKMIMSQWEPRVFPHLC